MLVEFTPHKNLFFVASNLVGNLGQFGMLKNLDGERLVLDLVVYLLNFHCLLNDRGTCAFSNLKYLASRLFGNASDLILLVLIW